jgi:hypothetical protein
MRSLSDVLYNFHWIVPGKAARSAQAYAGFLGAFLRSRNIKSVINLRGSNPHHMWWRYETRVCAKLGVAHFDAMLSSRRPPVRQMLVDLIAAFDNAPTPLLLKCSGGQDRTSFAAALYLLHVKGWDAFEEARGQFASWPYLHWPKRHQVWLGLFPEFAKEECAGRAFDDWVRQGYQPERFKTWLESRGMGGSFRGLYDRPVSGA